MPDWSLIGSMLGVFSVVIGAGIVYLKLFIGNEIKDLKIDLQQSIQLGFYNREMMDSKLNELFTRVTSLEESRRQHSKET